MNLNELSKRAFVCALKRKKVKRSTPPCLAVKDIQSELIELEQALHKVRSKHIPLFDEHTEELADVIIVSLSLAGLMGYDIEAAILAKMAYNEKRKD